MTAREHIFFVIPRVSCYENAVAIVTGFVTRQELHNPDEFYRTSSTGR